MKFRIGTGTIITLLLPLSLVGYHLLQQRIAAMRPPIVEREVQGLTAHDIAPAPEFLLHHRQDLGLSAG